MKIPLPLKTALTTTQRERETNKKLKFEASNQPQTRPYSENSSHLLKGIFLKRKFLRIFRKGEKKADVIPIGIESEFGTEFENLTTNGNVIEFLNKDENYFLKCYVMVGIQKTHEYLEKNYSKFKLELYIDFPYDAPPEFASVELCACVNFKNKKDSSLIGHIQNINNVITNLEKKVRPKIENKLLDRFGDSYEMTGLFFRFNADSLSNSKSDLN